MNDYRAVSDAMAAGASPSMLCATCPWDRYCITPPTMTKQDVDTRIEEAKAKDEAKDKASPNLSGMPINMLMNLVAFASKDIEAMVCPVFAMRLRSSEGRDIVDGLKDTMKAWNDMPRAKP